MFDKVDNPVKFAMFKSAVMTLVDNTKDSEVTKGAALACQEVTGQCVGTPMFLDAMDLGRVVIQKHKELLRQHWS